MPPSMVVVPPGLAVTRRVPAGREPGTRRAHVEPEHTLNMMERHQMRAKPSARLRDGAPCRVIGGTHQGKSGTVRDIKTGKTGQVSITVVQSSGVRFKTLARNVVVESPPR